MNAKNNPPEQISYKLLDELSKQETVTQRALADRLGIALGLVNAYIKRLYKKGFIKIKTLPRNRIKYIITPQGFAEKTRLTYKYMHYSILFFQDVRQKIECTYDAMLTSGIHRVLLWGDGELAELCFMSTRGLSLDIVGAVGRKRNERGFFGRTVYTPDDIDIPAHDAILVATLSEKSLAPLQGLSLIHI